jgi:hypothetical protein
VGRVREAQRRTRHERGGPDAATGEHRPAGSTAVAVRVAGTASEGCSVRLLRSFVASGLSPRGAIARTHPRPRVCRRGPRGCSRTRRAARASVETAAPRRRQCPRLTSPVPRCRHGRAAVAPVRVLLLSQASPLAQRETAAMLRSLSKSSDAAAEARSSACGHEVQDPGVEGDLGVDLPVKRAAERIGHGKSLGLI